MNLQAVESLLGGLNEYQLRAANVGAGQVAVVGNPGAGKTWTLIGRMARLARDGFDLKWCLAMTFTRYAAAEINSRLTQLGLPSAGRVGTIHSLGHEILMTSAPGMTTGRSIDESGWKTEMLLKRLLSAERYRSRRYDLDEVSRLFEHAKATGECPIFGNPLGANLDAVRRIEKMADVEHWDERTGLAPGMLSEVFMDLEGQKAANGLYGFDDMQCWAWMLLARAPHVLAHWRQRWSLIMVDEGQDSTPVQWDMAFMLAGMQSTLSPSVEPAGEGPWNIMVLGDVSQSVYAFRSASPETYLEFIKDPLTEVITLPINYRSVPEICKAGSGLVLGEEWHLGGEMVSGRKNGTGIDVAVGEDGPVRLCTFSTVGEEAQWVINECVRIRSLTGSWRSLAVLARLSTFLNFFELECIRRGIPYEKRAYGTFAGGKEVTGLVGYLKVAGGWDATGKAERAIVNVPFRFIGRNALDLADRAHRGGSGYLDVLLECGKLSLRQQRSIQDLQETLSTLQMKMEAGDKPRVLIDYVLARTDFVASLKMDSGAGSLSPDAAKLAAVEQVAWLAGLFERAADFVTFMEQLNEGVKLGRKRLQVADATKDALVLSTIHSAKGQEWPFVFMCDVVPGRHPWHKAHSLAEELRLGYVGFTRAERQITVTASKDTNSAGSVESFVLRKLRRAAGGLIAIRNHSEEERPG